MTSEFVPHVVAEVGESDARCWGHSTFGSGLCLQKIVQKVCRAAPCSCSPVQCKKSEHCRERDQCFTRNGLDGPVVSGQAKGMTDDPCNHTRWKHTPFFRPSVAAWRSRRGLGSRRLCGRRRKPRLEPTTTERGKFFFPRLFFSVTVPRTRLLSSLFTSQPAPKWLRTSVGGGWTDG